MSKAALIPALFLLVAVQSGSRGSSHTRIAVRCEEPADLRDLLHRGNAAFRSGEYLRAIQIYEDGYAAAIRRGVPQSAARFLNNLGSVHFQLFQYRNAIDAYLKARDLARSQGDREALGALCVNLSSLYAQMGDLDAASETVDQGLRLPRGITAKYRPKLLIQYAYIKWRRNNSGEAVKALRDAIEASRSQLDPAAESQAWNEMGSALLESGRLAEAEDALLEAFRMRKLTHDDRIYFTYDSLANLRVRQSDWRSALVLFDRALESARSASPSAMWNIYYDRGKAHLAQGQTEEAFADFGAALEGVRRWRAEVIPADSFRVSAEVDLHHVYSAYVEIASRLYAQTRRKQFAEEAYAVSEESRAASLRALWAGDDLTRALPTEYWGALAGLLKAEAALMKGGSGQDQTAVRPWRVKVAEMEARAGLDLKHGFHDSDPTRTSYLEQTRKALRPSDVYLGFHLGDQESYLWMVARDGFDLRRLPPRTQLADRIATFAKAVRERSPDLIPQARRMYAELFGASNPILLRKARWIVAPDGPLFDLPLAALVEPADGPSGSPVYVIERHAIQIVPGASAILETSPANANGTIVGLADPIYNRADPRLRASALQKEFGIAKAASADTPGPLELARLAGSSREIENCARVWRSHGYQPILLKGADATKQNLERALQRDPMIVHVAAHLLFPPERSSPGLLALTPRAGADPELLSATEIASMRLKLGVVVLNGCDSGRGAALPGAGLMGMTRAWLAAGARAVVATRWATSDQSEGVLFQSFYERLPLRLHSRTPKSFAELLQEAQLAEIRAGGRRADPAYWAAYFCVERN
jgi:CHAT domain-containing protein